MVTIMHKEPVRRVRVVIFYFEIVDKTVWTHSAKRSVTCWFENLNTVHPIEFKNDSFF